MNEAARLNRQPTPFRLPSDGAADTLTARSLRAVMDIQTAPIPESHGPDQVRGPNNAYPRLLRAFAGSSLAAAVCGLAAVAADGDKGLHPAPFVAMGTLLAIAAACSFLVMLTCLTAQAIQRWCGR